MAAVAVRDFAGTATSATVNGIMDELQCSPRQHCFKCNSNTPILSRQHCISMGVGLHLISHLKTPNRQNNNHNKCAQRHSAFRHLTTNNAKSDPFCSKPVYKIWP
nr:hypothetical protein Itr_chr14CG24820 [Ipomoea trifida]